jgi:hypothetical protein
MRSKETVWLEELIKTKGKSKEAFAAFRALGAKAVPFLVQELTNSSSFRNKYVTAKSSVNSGKVYKLLQLGVITLTGNAKNMQRSHWAQSERRRPMPCLS